MKNKKIVYMIVGGLVIALLSFRGGMIYTNAKNSTGKFANGQGNFSQNSFGQNGGIRGGQGMMRGGANGGFVTGQVLSIDAKSMTVKLNNGGSKIVLFSPMTTVEKTVSGVTGDVIVGKSVMVTGVTNPDGSVSATSIQIRPALPAAPVKQ